MSSIGAVDYLPVTNFSRRALDKFECTNQAMQKFLPRFARKNHKDKIGHTEVMVPKSRTEPILGYVTYAMASTEKGDPPIPSVKEFPRYPLPVMLIARLAVSSGHARQGLGGRLLIRAFEVASQASEKIAAVGVITDAVDSDAVAFYQKFDFEILDPNATGFPRRMFIRMDTVQDMLSP